MIIMNNCEIPNNLKKQNKKFYELKLIMFDLKNPLNFKSHLVPQFKTIIDNKKSISFEEFTKYHINDMLSENTYPDLCLFVTNDFDTNPETLINNVYTEIASINRKNEFYTPKLNESIYIHIYTRFSFFE